MIHLSSPFHIFLPFLLTLAFVGAGWFLPPAHRRPANLLYWMALALLGAVLAVVEVSLMIRLRQEGARPYLPWVRAGAPWLAPAAALALALVTRWGIEQGRRIPGDQGEDELKEATLRIARRMWYALLLAGLLTVLLIPLAAENAHIGPLLAR